MLAERYGMEASKGGKRRSQRLTWKQKQVANETWLSAGGPHDRVTSARTKSPSSVKQGSVPMQEEGPGQWPRSGQHQEKPVSSISSPHVHNKAVPTLTGVQPHGQQPAQGAIMLEDDGKQEKPTFIPMDTIAITAAPSSEMKHMSQRV